MRKFRFLGYGDLQPVPDSVNSYSEMDSTKYYWFTSGVFTEGKVYKMRGNIRKYETGLSDDASFIDDEGDLMCQELQFFEEIV